MYDWNKCSLIDLRTDFWCAFSNPLYDSMKTLYARTIKISVIEYFDGKIFGEPVMRLVVFGQKSRKVGFYAMSIKENRSHIFFQTWYEQQKSFFRLLIGSSVTVESFWVNVRSVSLFRFEEILKKIQVVELTLITFFCHNSKSGVLLSRHKPKKHIIFDTFFTKFTKLKKTPY